MPDSPALPSPAADPEAAAPLARRMPVLFVGHGSPMNAVEDNAWSRGFAAIGAEMPRPAAILAVSAHWYGSGTFVTANDVPETIHDFSGFPEALYRISYPAPGDADLARRVVATVGPERAATSTTWGIDHGTWSVLVHLRPRADVPVLQLSIDARLAPEEHLAIGRRLAPLRDEGVLILGSGNVVHNLYRIVWQDTAFDWAADFDETVKRLILEGDHDALIRYRDLGSPARLAVPTNEHFLPLLYVLSLRQEGEPLVFFAEGVTLGTISMRAFRVG